MSRRGTCTGCNKDKQLRKDGMCKPCLRQRDLLDIPDGESLCRLDESGWFKDDNGIMRHRSAQRWTTL